MTEQPIDILKPDPANPRRISPEALTGLGVSMETFGDLSTVVWNERTGQLVAGHQRMEQLRAAGVTTWRRDGQGGEIVHPKTGERFPVRIVDWDETTERLANLTANNPHLQGEYTPEALEQIKAIDDDVNYRALRLDALQASMEAAVPDVTPAAAGLTDPDAVPDPPKVPVTKPGDLWLLGEHRLLCGDCRDSKVVARLLGRVAVNVAITSPPYASQRKYDETSGFKPVPPEKYVDWFDSVQANVAAHLAADGSFFLNMKEHCEDGQRALYVKELTLAHVRKWGWWFVDELAWTHRGLPGTWPNRFKNAWEPVFHFSRRGSIKFRPETVGHESEDVFHEGGRVSGTNRTGNIGWHGGDVARSTGTALPGNVIDIPNNPANHGGADHSAAFPVALPEFFIKAFSDERDVVLDPFLGSGSTLIAAERNKRLAFGLEISPAYCDVIVTRWEAFTGKKATREPAPRAAAKTPRPKPAKPRRK